MSTSDKLTYLNETKAKIKNAINLTGANITNETFRQYPNKLYEKYLDILKNGTSALFEHMPRVTGSGTELTLNDTANLPMSVELSASESTQDSAILPSEYQQVEYIKSNNGPYINTGVIPSFNTKIELDFLKDSTDSSSSLNFLYGSRIANNNACHGFIAYISSLDAYPQFANKSDAVNLTNNPNLLSYDIRHKLINGKDGCYLDGVQIQTYTNQTTLNSELSMYLFALNQNGSVESRKAIARIYSFKVYEDNILIRNFIPCYRISDNKIGMYDIVNNVFYTNVGSGTFEKGDDVSLPNSEYATKINVVTGENSIKIANENGTLDRTFPLSLGNLELAKIIQGTTSTTDYVYEDNNNWYKHKEVNKKVLNGSENWSLQSINDLGIANFQLLVSDYVGNKNNVSICDRFKPTDKPIAQTTSESYFFNIAKMLFIRINSNTADTVEKFKTWLASNNVTVYYQLGTPIEEQITDTTLISQLEELKNATSYDEQTNISQTNANRPFVISASAIKNSME